MTLGRWGWWWQHLSPSLPDASLDGQVHPVSPQAPQSVLGFCGPTWHPRRKGLPPALWAQQVLGRQGVGGSHRVPHQSSLDSRNALSLPVPEAGRPSSRGGQGGPC